MSKNKENFNLNYKIKPTAAAAAEPVCDFIEPFGVKII